MLKTSFKDGIYDLQMNRPEMRNALNKALRRELAESLKTLPEGTRLVTLTGVKEAFCSGQDLSEFDQDSDIQAIMNEEYKPITDAIDALNVPIIAGVQGACAGAGVSLALGCDLVVASDESFFQIAFGRVGLVPDILVTYQLPRLVGGARAMGMALTGQKVEAKQAAEWGMIWQSVAAFQFDEWFRELTVQMAKGPSLSLGMTRQLMRQTWENTLAEQFKFEAECQKRAGQSRDFVEGVQAFLEKRPPQFSGR